MKRTPIQRKPSSIKPRTPKPKKCAHCGEAFQPFQSTQKTCGIPCAIAMAPSNRETAEKAIRARERDEHRKAKDKVKTKAKWMSEAQAAFNAWVRLRDAGQPCISCGTTADVQYCAGHFRTTAAAPELRFEPLNVHLQCNRNCNMAKSGNLLNYRPALIAKIGLASVEWLEGPHEPKRYTIDDLKAIKAKYKALAKELKSN